MYIWPLFLIASLMHTSLFIAVNLIWSLLFKKYCYCFNIKVYRSTKKMSKLNLLYQPGFLSKKLMSKANISQYIIIGFKTILKQQCQLLRSICGLLRRNFQLWRWPQVHRWKLRKAKIFFSSMSFTLQTVLAPHLARKKIKF